MQLFLVERYLPGADRAVLDSLQARLRTAVASMQRGGSDVAWLQSIVVPGDDTCLCLFRASGRALVVEANARATADWERISPVLGAGEL
jgi:hypothetical protein